MQQSINSNDNISTELLKDIVRRIQKELTDNPPTIGIVGVSGVGKSSTINALFRTNLQTSDTVACTKEFENVDLSLQILRGEGEGQRVHLRVVDAPGLGEDISKDPEYLELYSTNLERCDVILWVLSARSRAIALDQLYLKQLQKFQDKIVFAINQIDLVEPIDWNEVFNIPSQTQTTNIEIIKQDRSARLNTVLGRQIPIVCYSSRKGFGLESLFKASLETVIEERQWIFEGLKNFSYRDYIPNNPVAKTLGLFARLLASSSK